MIGAPEPMDKLDAVLVTANGPEGDLPDWDAVVWRRVAEDVRRLRQRIFTASQAGDLAKVRNLQKLMLRSRSNALLSVRRVTEHNAGRKTAGVDGVVVLSSRGKAEMADWLQHGATAWKPRPVRRVFIPKAHGKLRGLGIPVIADRCLQALTVNALESEWEARFESRSYGFRPGRSCQDAMQAIFVTARGETCKRCWVLDADLAAAFDRLDHDHLLGRLGQFPARERVRGWLKAGVIEHGRLAPTERGSPQGGVISPVLMNVALHGMEQAAGVRYIRTGSNAGTAKPGSPVLVRYADDLLALCHSREQAEQVNAQLVLIRLNPIIRGWSAYYRHAVSSKVFNSLDDHVWRLTYKWAKFTHPHKSKQWVVPRYFGAFNSARKDRWVFGDRDSGAYLLKFSWANITRHTLVKGWASPDDPTLASYWEARRRREKPALGRARLRLLQAQHGLCPLCGDLLLYADHEPRHPDEWEQWITATGKAIRRQALVVTGPGTPGERTVHRLIHTHCRRRQPDGNGSVPAPQLRP